MKRKTMRPLFSAVLQSLDKLLFGYMQRTGLLSCVAHSDIASFSDTRYYISATLPDTYDAAGYQSTDLVWSEFSLVRQFPQCGAMSEVNRWNPIRGAIKKAKRTPDFGGGDMVVADLPTEQAQIIAKAAATTQPHVSIKVVYAVDSETHFLDAIVTSFQLAQSASGEFMERTIGLQFNREEVVIPAV